MSRPNEFLLNTDFDAIANSADYAASISISGTVAAGDKRDFFVSITTSGDYPMLQVQFTTSLQSSRRYILGHYSFFSRSGGLPGSSGANYNIYPLIYNSSARAAVVGFTASNPYNDTLTLQSETITFTVKGFKPPFAV